MPLNEPKTGDSVRETPRIYVRQEDRYEDLQSSASAFMIVCVVMSLLSLFSFGSSLHLPFSIPATPMMRFFFIFFAIGSFVICIKTRREAAKTYARIEEEQRITEELEAWFLSSYTPGQIDLQIFGANRRPLRPEALALKRFDFIQDCFLKRYEGMDEGYIEALSEELYKKLFESGMNSVNTATPEEAADNAETLPDASAHAACATAAAPRGVGGRCRIFGKQQRGSRDKCGLGTRFRRQRGNRRKVRSRASRRGRGRSKRHSECRKRCKAGR